MKRVMSDEQQNAAGRRRSRRAGSTARVEALERLKSMRRGGRRSESGGFQIKMEEPIYDTVDEEEYQALVTKRRQEVRGFIVDDNGLGYGDEGEEEDWSQAQDGLDLSSGESDAERERQKRKKVEKKANEASQKKTGPSSGLSAAAALMGKQRISAMFTKSIFKKKEDGAKGLSCDSLVDDVIAEFAPDEADREMRRKGYGALPSKVRGTVLHSSVMTEVPHSGRGKMSVRQELNEVRGNNGDSRVGLEKNCGVPEGKNLSGECAYVADMTSEKSSDLPAEYDNSSTKASVIKDANVSEIKEEQVVRKGEGHSLNAIIVEEKDPALSATAGWQEVRSGEDKRNACDVVETVAAMNSNEKLDFELDSDGSLPFFIIDAHEEIYGANMGTLYLFGKVKAGCTYHSCCIVVRNMQRCVYAIPGDDSIIQNEVVRKLEKDAEEFRISHINLRKRLLEVASDLKNEVAKKLVDHNISSFSTSLVKRKYTFERSDIPVGDNYVLKINYSFKDPPLPADLRGETFRALLATHCSALELFLVKRKIIGPSWLAVAKFSICPAAQRVSWCKYEVTVDCPKDIKTSDSIKTAEFPPLVVTAVNLKTITNEKQNANEIVSASIICCHKVKIDTPMPTSEWKKSGALSHFTVVRKLDGSIFPMGFTKEAADRNSKAGSNVIGFESSERALLNRLLIELYKLDTDVLVGHNISMFDLDVLLHRAQACRVPSSTWSKIGRLKRSIMPKITKSNTTFGFGASPGIMSCIAGRLLCDTFLCSRDLLKEVSYSLSQLAKTQLNKDHKEVAPHDIPTMFQTAESLMELIEYNETNAWLSVELMFHLSILPLTRELTKISGNLWQKTLQGARAQRVEYLLLHAFHAKKYVVPDKISFHAKETKLKKRRVNQDIEEGVIDDLANDLNDDLPQNNHGKSKRAPAYSGGLVLDPKAGLYDKYILLLDFNSLYPSIIQEYNICFTTVERSIDGQAPKLPSSRITGVLPELLKDLVERRRRIKQWMKTASGLKFQQFDIRQQALKLTANSMYGCLGFTNSRFYAKPLAELITLQGREILQSTADLVQNNLNLEVIYGDTDSIMIYTGLDDITKAKAFAGKVIQEVNKKYRCLEIDLDGLYKRMLLLKKKKYAAVKVQFKDGTPYEVIERKGLDMVRRDWSLLSKELGDFCLSQILSGGSCDDVVETIHNALTKVREDMKNGEIALEKYVITKTLTKPPEAYPDGKNQPHVQVALRLRQNNYSTSCSVGDTVPYIICCEQGTSSSISPGIAQRARHPDELRRDDGKWMIDIDYYLSQQIHPVVLRLCAPIQGTSPGRLAECLGLDSSKFQSKTSETSATDLSSALFAALDDTERYQGCEPLTLSCPSCSGTFICPTVLHSLSTRIGEKQAGNQVEQSIQNFWHGLHCPRCPQEDDAARLSPKMIANQVKRQAEGFVARYYTGLMTCDDETCKYTTRSVNLRVFGDSERGAVCPNHPRCSGRLTRKYTEADLYKQLMYFCHVLDTVNCLSKVEDRNRILLQKELAKIRPLVESAAEAAQTIRDRCAYGWVRVNDLVVTV